MTGFTQLSLPVHLPDDERFDSFFASDNQQLVDSLARVAGGEGELVTYFWGSAKSGRTHLLHASCALASELGRSVFYLPLGIHRSMSPDILEGLEQLSLVCLDDIDTVSRNPVWEEALFNLFNRVAEAESCHLIVAASSPARRANFLLPDLVSRLDWGINYQLHPLSDEAKLLALQLRAKMRGLELEEEVGRFLLTRLDRDPRTLFTALDTLDKASMVEKRRLTIPFVKKILHL